MSSEAYPNFETRRTHRGGSEGKLKGMVEIPETLIQKIHPLGPHFIRVGKRGKNPIDQAS
jgi:hypothetical protein